MRTRSTKLPKIGKTVSPAEYARHEQERLYPSSLWQLCRAVSTPVTPVVHTVYAVTLPEICLDVRASLTGSADRKDDATLERIGRMLAARLESWQEPSDGLDAAIRKMVEWTLEFIADELHRRNRNSIRIV